GRTARMAARAARRHVAWVAAQAERWCADRTTATEATAAAVRAPGRVVRARRARVAAAGAAPPARRAMRRRGARGTTAATRRRLPHRARSARPAFTRLRRRAGE